MRYPILDETFYQGLPDTGLKVMVVEWAALHTSKDLQAEVIGSDSTE